MSYNKRVLVCGSRNFANFNHYKDGNNKSRGTSRMVKIAKEAGIEVMEFNYV